MNFVKSKISFLCLFVFIISFFFLNKIIFAQEEFGLPVMPPGGASPLDIGPPPEIPAIPPIAEVPMAMPFGEGVLPLDIGVYPGEIPGEMPFPEVPVPGVLPMAPIPGMPSVPVEPLPGMPIIPGEPPVPGVSPITPVPVEPSVPGAPLPGMPVIPGEPPIPGAPAISGMPMPPVTPVGVPVPPPVAPPVTETQRPLISIPDKPVHLSETGKTLVSQSNAPGVEGRIDEVKNIIDQINNILMQMRSLRDGVLNKFRDTDQKLDSLYQTLGFQRGQMVYVTSKPTRTRTTRQR